MSLIAQLIQAIGSNQLWEDEITVARNEYLKVEGSTDTRLYYILNGSLRIYVLQEYEEHTIRFGYQNNLIGALDSFITEQPSDLYIQALKKSDLKIISKKRLLGLLESDTSYLKLWYQILEQLVYQQMERERDLLTNSPMERYQRVLKRSPQLFQEIPNKYIASYLRMTPETLSRLKKS